MYTGSAEASVQTEWPHVVGDLGARHLEDPVEQVHGVAEDVIECGVRVVSSIVRLTQQAGYAADTVMI